jgi:hypothetical protein
MRWWIKGGSRVQRRAISLAVADLKAALGDAGGKIWPGKCHFFMDEYALADMELGSSWSSAWSRTRGRGRLGVAEGKGRGGVAKVWLRHSLSPRQAYAIALHELGHVLGIEHAERGIMAARPPLPLPRPLRVRDRRRWTAEVANRYRRAVAT